MTAVVQGFSGNDFSLRTLSRSVSWMLVAKIITGFRSFSRGREGHPGRSKHPVGGPAANPIQMQIL